MGKLYPTLLLKSWAKTTTTQPKPNKNVYNTLKTLGFHLPPSVPSRVPPASPLRPCGASGSNALTHADAESRRPRVRDREPATPNTAAVRLHSPRLRRTRTALRSPARTHTALAPHVRSWIRVLRPWRRLRTPPPMTAGEPSSSA